VLGSVELNFVSSVDWLGADHQVGATSIDITCTQFEKSGSARMLEEGRVYRLVASDMQDLQQWCQALFEESSLNQQVRRLDTIRDMMIMHC